jgi:uncharacterized protein YlzI (FlbEa/FlbD family)
MSKLSLSLDISSNTNAFLYGTTASLVAGGYIPDFSLDLINDSYRSEKGNKPFTNLVEHNSATAGNATMTNSDGDIVWRPHNLLSYSEDMSQSNVWNNSGVTETANSATAPDNTLTANKIEITTAGSYRNTNQLVTAVPLAKYKAVVYAKKGNHDYIKINAQARNSGSFVSGLNDISVDLTDGTIITGSSNGSVTSVGSDWYLIELNAAAVPASGVNQVGFFAEFVDSQGVANPSTNIASGSYFYIWGAHLYRSDLGGMAPVPTDFQTAGSTTYVRTAGRVIGPELVTNGTFDTDSDWTYSSTVSISGGKLNFNATNTNYINAKPATPITFVTGRVYEVKIDIDSITSGQWQVFVDRSTDLVLMNGSSAGSFVAYFVADGTENHINIARYPVTQLVAVIDNFSVKEIDVNPATARYLPRIGHHVYNGSAWVNEGLLHESGTRTNVVPYSEDLSNSAWSKESSSVAAADDAFGLNMWTITDSSSSAYGIVLDYVTIPADTQFTGSILVKKNDSPTSQFSMRFVGNNGGSIYVGDSLNVDDGTAEGNMWTTYTEHTSVEDWGTHWKLSVTGKFPAGSSTNVGLQLFPAHNNTSGGGSSANTGSHVVGGVQVETGSVASSYIPTFGSTVTRAAETLRIEHEDLPWPSPYVIGDELVTNGDFDGDVDDFTNAGTATVTYDATEGAAKVNVTGSGGGIADDQTITVTSGKVYLVSVTLKKTTFSGDLHIQVEGTNVTDLTPTTSYQTFTAVVVAGDSDLSVAVVRKNSPTGIFFVSNISVKEINPLSVSIAMEGRMTYTDNDLNSEFNFYDWYIASNDYLRTYFQTNGGTGKITASQNDAGTFDGKSTGGSDFSPGVLVPYSFAVRHGSTFINMSSDGSSLTENTTPVNLPDASSTDLRLGKGATNNYIGTIRSFRVWANDIGDDGIVEASSPSLEPTLSLSFDGTETSFIDFEWSE